MAKHYLRHQGVNTDIEQIYLLNSTLDHCHNLLPYADVVLFSYSLTMMNGKQAVQKNLNTAYEQRRTGGLIGIVDFFKIPLQWFENWMRLNHIHWYESPFGPRNFRNRIDTIHSTITEAYFGL